MATKWIFFDLDGTLTGNLRTLFRVYDGFLGAYGRKGNRREFNQLNGASVPSIIKTLQSNHCLASVTYEELIGRYRRSLRDNYAENVSLRYDAKAVLQALKKRKYRLLLATSGERSIADYFLKKQGISKYFTVKLFGDDVKKHKPHPDIYRLALKRAGCRKNEACVVEDSLNGCLAAQRAGLDVIQFKSDSSVAVKSIYVVKKLSQLLPYFKKLS